jgi:putative ATP-dependent endonuclease of OLD family
MRIRRVAVQRFRGIEGLVFTPGPRTVILGPNNAGKSAILEALDLLLHPGFGRPRPAPDELDYFERNPAEGFEVEAVLGNLDEPLLPDVHQHLEGWQQDERRVVPQPDGEGIEPVVRVRVRGTPEFAILHEFAKPESDGARFHPAFRARMGWVFDGRTRDPERQLAFYQGGLLDRLFAGADLEPAIDALRQALGQGADEVNRDDAITGVVADLSADLKAVGLLKEDESARFEAGDISRRALLQALRLALPSTGDVAIPLSRQGRGARRLVLVAVLLRLAEATGTVPVGGFEEPEEALEPLRQAQLANMLLQLANKGGQIFVVTHSPEIIREFAIEDFLLLEERAAGKNARHLQELLSAPIRQAYERRIDGAVVRGLFSRVPILVEGPSDRAVFQTFWSELTRSGKVQPAFRCGLDVVNCEGVANMPMVAAVLHEAGKSVAAWADQDSDEALREINRLKGESHCAALLLHSPDPGRQNLEQALAATASLDGLVAALSALGADRGYSWEEQRNDLLSRCDHVDADARGRAKATMSLADFMAELDEEEARNLAASALGAKGVTPFEMKGARQARLMARTIVDADGVPASFARALQDLSEWIRAGCEAGAEFVMSVDG